MPKPRRASGWTSSPLTRSLNAAQYRTHLRLCDPLGGTPLSTLWGTLADAEAEPCRMLHHCPAGEEANILLQEQQAAASASFVGSVRRVLQILS